MTKKDFIKKWGVAVRDAGYVEDFTNDLETLLSIDSRTNESVIDTLKRAVNWVGLQVDSRTLFLITQCFMRILEKENEFSLKDAANIFAQAEQRFTENNRVAYGAQFWYIDINFNKAVGNDYRLKEDNDKFASGNYFCNEEKCEETIKKFVKQVLRKINS